MSSVWKKATMSTAAGGRLRRRQASPFSPRAVGVELRGDAVVRRQGEGAKREEDKQRMRVNHTRLEVKKRNERTRKWKPM